MKKNPKKIGVFFTYLALARSNPERDLLLTAYSCSHQAYSSNGVSYSPNPAGGWEKMGPKVGPVVKNGDFWGHFQILGPKEAPGGSENIKNGLSTPKNPYLDTSHVSELPLGAKW